MLFCINSCYLGMVKKNVVPTAFSDSIHILPPPEVITFLIINSPIVQRNNNPNLQNNN